MTDWSTGRYEYTASDLMPAAEHVVGLARVQPGEHVLDVGCGTGNAAAVAAQAGAVVTGVDPAHRLLEDAAQRVPSGTFMHGGAEQLPFGAEEFDAVVSVFGAIFAPDRRAAVREMLRVLKPGGRALVSAWRPEGAIHDSVGSLMRAVGAPPPPPGRLELEQPQHAVPELEQLARVTVHEGELAFVKPSAGVWMDEQELHHPMAIGAVAALRARGAADEARADALRVLEAANEDPEGFRVTSRYVVYELRSR